jgi:hypothetical protein
LGKLADIILFFVANRWECIVLFPKYSSAGGAGGEAAMPLNRSLVSSPNAELCRFFKASEVLPSFAAPSDPGGDSRPNLDGTEEAIGPFLAIQDTPLLSKEAGSGASKTLKPFVATGDMAYRLISSSRGEPYCDVGWEA